MDANLKAEILRLVFEHENRLPMRDLSRVCKERNLEVRMTDLNPLIASQELALVDGVFLIPNPQAYYASLNPPVVRKPATTKSRRRSAS